MRQLTSFPSLLMTASLFALYGGGTAMAQAPATTDTSTAAAAATVQSAQAAVPMAGTGAASSVLARIGRSLNLTILTDSTIQERVPIPAEPTTAENASQQITAVLQSLPPSTRWIELYIPKPQGNLTWNADRLVAYFYAQEKALGTPPPSAAGTATLLGQPLSEQKAAPIASDLSLYHVCLVTDASRVSANSGGDPVSSEWSQMAPAQQDAYLQQTAASILSMPDSQRQEAMDHVKFYDQLKDALETQIGHKVKF